MTLSFSKMAALAIVLAVPVAYAAGPVKTADLLVRYFANLDKGDSVVNLTNSGSDPAGDICANFYGFDAEEELVSCCACPLTPNSLMTLSLQRDVLGNLLTPGTPNEMTIVIVPSTDAPNCNAATVTPAQTDALRAWGTTIHALPGGNYGVTETEFSFVPSSPIENLTSVCSFIQSNGSSYGLCKACYPGAQGAARQ